MLQENPLKHIMQLAWAASAVYKVKDIEFKFNPLDGPVKKKLRKKINKRSYEFKQDSGLYR